MPVEKWNRRKWIRKEEKNTKTLNDFTSIHHHHLFPSPIGEVYTLYTGLGDYMCVCGCEYASIFKQSFDTCEKFTNFSHFHRISWSDSFLIYKKLRMKIALNHIFDLFAIFCIQNFIYSLPWWKWKTDLSEKKTTETKINFIRPRRYILSLFII